MWGIERHGSLKPVMIAQVVVHVVMMTVHSGIVVSIVMIALLVVVSTVTTVALVVVLTAMTGTAVHVLLHKNGPLRCVLALVSDVRPAHRQRRPTEPVRSGSTKVLLVPHVAPPVFAPRERVVPKRVVAKKYVHSIQWLRSSNANSELVLRFEH